MENIGDTVDKLQVSIHNLEKMQDPLELLTYGISWKPNVADPIVTRVGNMTYHKTLPIQNNMKGCIAQMKDGVKIIYFLNSSDWRWKENERGSVIKSQELTVTGDVYKLSTENILIK